MISFKKGDIFLNGDKLFYDIRLTLHIKGEKYYPDCEISDGKFVFSEKEHRFLGELDICADSDNSVTFSFNGGFEPHVFNDLCVIDPVGYEISVGSDFEKMIYTDNPSETFQNIKFTSDYDYCIFDEKSEYILAKKGDYNCFFSGICNGPFKTYFRADWKCIKVYVTAEANGYNNISGKIFTASLDKDPYNAVKCGYKTISKYTNTPLLETKKIPDFINYLGYCTWNAFYHSVSKENTEKKLSEFKNSGVPVKMLLIDDGWFECDCIKGSEQLKTKAFDYCAREDRFPGGFKAMINDVKENFGIKYFGVWHSFCADWLGIVKDSRFYNEFKEYLTEMPSGIILPDIFSAEKCEKFFDKWYTYFENEKIDFLKVDSQGTLKRFTKDVTSNANAAKNMSLAVEKAAEKHLNSNVLNCMAMGVENVQNRPVSAVTRTSADFVPENPVSFNKHLIQNAYNSIFTRDLFRCDFDMFWSVHETAEKSAILRAVSGGPVYVSDELDKSDPQLLKALCDENGRIAVLDSCAVPTKDLLYKNPEKTGFIKLANSIDDVSLLAVFNLTECIISVEISSEDFIKDSEEYVLQIYKNDTFIPLKKGDKIRISVSKGDAIMINAYPVKDGCAFIGDTSKIISAGFNRTKMNLKEILL